MNTVCFDQSLGARPKLRAALANVQMDTWHRSNPKSVSLVLPPPPAVTRARGRWPRAVTHPDAGDKHAEAPRESNCDLKEMSLARRELFSSFFTDYHLMLRPLREKIKKRQAAMCELPVLF